MIMAYTATGTAGLVDHKHTMYSSPEISYCVKIYVYPL